MVRRLAFTKAQAIADHHPDALVIGSDQVALIGSEIVGKPGDYDSAFAQLQRASAANISFLTSICVLASSTQGSLIDCIAAGVTIRRLDAVTIERYLRLEQPYDCAGSIKCEGLGITLIEKFVGDDPTALIGLPLIRLTTMLQRFGYDVLAAGASVTEAVRAPPD
jgi:septum formation protein